MWDFDTLKTKTFELWQSRDRLNECIPVRPFLDEVESYGDLEQIDTWKTAYAAMRATFFADGCLEDGQYLIEFYLLYASKTWGWRDLLPLVVAHLCMIPEAVEAIADGLRTLHQSGCDYGCDWSEIEQFKEIVSEQHPELREWRPQPAAIPA